jgi:hypothetical protein
MFENWVLREIFGSKKKEITGGCLPDNIKKVPHNRPEGPEGGRGIALLFLDLGARRSGWSAPRPGRFTPEKEPVPIVQEAWWARGPV